MECPKGARNGPCGGSTQAHCYVDPTRPCIWYHIYDRAFRLGREEKLLEVLPPLDWDKVGTETWGDVVRQVQKVGFKTVFTGLLARDPHQVAGDGCGAGYRRRWRTLVRLFHFGDRYHHLSRQCFAR